MAHRDSSPVGRFSVWLKPQGEALQRLLKLMRRFHERGGGPRFEPHLTLLSGSETTIADAELKLRHLGQRLAPFTVELTGIRSQDDYFRSLYAVASPGEALERARAAAYEVFEMNPPPPYEPHVSLLYGNQDEALKRELALEAGALELTFTVDAVHLVDASSGVPVTAWKTLASRPLEAAGAGR